MIDLGVYWTYAVYLELQIRHDTETGLYSSPCIKRATKL